MISRSARPEDAKAIATIHVRSWQAAYPGMVPTEYLENLSIEQREDAWRQRLESGATDTWLVEESDQPVGWISVGASRDRDAGASVGELYAIYVDPDHWRHGVGQRLWQDAESRLKSSGVCEVMLWVLRDNVQAIRFYRSIGFAIDAGIEKTVELGGAKLIEIRLRKRIGG
jgi:ribosomal protein S18 acetylase RimI-like enzyme